MLRGVKSLSRSKALLKSLGSPTFLVALPLLWFASRAHESARSSSHTALSCGTLILCAPAVRRLRIPSYFVSLEWKVAFVVVSILHFILQTIIYSDAEISLMSALPRARTKRVGGAECGPLTTPILNSSFFLFKYYFLRPYLPFQRFRRAAG